jgi:iron complex transport system ATP-binding protein
MGLIIASHDLNLLSELADELWLLKDGKMVADGPIESVLTSESLSLLYPNRMVHVVRSPDTGKKKVIY